MQGKRKKKTLPKKKRRKKKSQQLFVPAALTCTFKRRGGSNFVRQMNKAVSAPAFPIHPGARKG